MAKMTDKITMFFPISKNHNIGVPSPVSAGIRVIFMQCFAVFFVCFLIRNCIASERPEFLNCSGVNDESIVKEILESDVSKNLSSGNLYLCWSESGAKFGSGDISGGDINSGNTGSSANYTTEENAKKSAGRCNERPWACLTESEKNKGQEVMYHFIGAILGLLIGSLIVIRSQQVIQLIYISPRHLQGDSSFLTPESMAFLPPF